MVNTLKWFYFFQKKRDIVYVNLMVSGTKIQRLRKSNYTHPLYTTLLLYPAGTCFTLEMQSTSRAGSGEDLTSSPGFWPLTQNQR